MTTNQSITCPSCHGYGQVLSDVLVGVERGQPLFERQTVVCEKCSGHRVLHKHPRGRVRVPLPYPTT